MAKEAMLCGVLLALCLCLCPLNAEKREPSVQIYTRHPVELGKENTIQCYVDKFHPPKISIDLLKNNQPMESHKSDLSFDSDWAFHQLVYANDIIDGKAEYTCKVEHETLSKPKIIKLDLEY